MADEAETTEAEEQPATTTLAEPATDPDVSGDDVSDAQPERAKDDDDDDADGEGEGEPKSAANKIPTWEEAISYLLHKQPT